MKEARHSLLPVTVSLNLHPVLACQAPSQMVTLNMAVNSQWAASLPSSWKTVQMFFFYNSPPKPHHLPPPNQNSWAHSLKNSLKDCRLPTKPAQKIFQRARTYSFESLQMGARRHGANAHHKSATLHLQQLTCPTRRISQSHQMLRLPQHWATPNGVRSGDGAQPEVQHTYTRQLGGTRAKRGVLRSLPNVLRCSRCLPSRGFCC